MRVLSASFNWTMAAAAGTNVCLRKVEPKPILDLIRDELANHKGRWTKVAADLRGVSWLIKRSKVTQTVEL